LVGLSVSADGRPTDLDALLAVAASPVALAAHGEATLRGRALNFLCKQELLRDEQFRLEGVGQLSWGFGYCPSAGNMSRWTPEVATAYERLVRARIEWLQANPGDDLTPERVAKVMADARRGLELARSLDVAVTWIGEIEGDCLGLEERSETRKALEKRLDEARREVTLELGRILRREDAEFVAGLYGRWHRMRCPRRWRLEWDRGAWPHRLTWLDFGLSRLSSYQKFEHTAAAAKSLREVRRLFAIWHTECRVVERDGVKVVVGDLGEGGVVRVIPC
jgi:hypothetical protein